jgi:excisionase family DNA binding protein
MRYPRPNPEPPLTLSVREAVRVTGLGKTTLFKLIDTGKLRRVKVGKRTLIPFTDLKKLVAAESEGDAA